MLARYTKHGNTGPSVPSYTAKHGQWRVQRRVKMAPPPRASLAGRA